MGGNGGGRGRHLLREGPAQVFIGLNQRLALGGVDDEALRRRVELYMGRESGAARAHNTGLPHRLRQIHILT